ncbi:PHO80 [Candida metapsilosis]|uniref:PHO80 n=1 Tax=Candida metapsilosis TaxID=273372 RepID=A0A8H7ZH78_9ASCO|nr:PHO80 [Candida metapsilosis]
MMMSVPSPHATPTSSPTGSAAGFNKFGEGNRNINSCCSSSRHYYMYRSALRQHSNKTPSPSELNSGKTSSDRIPKYPNNGQALKRDLTKSRNIDDKNNNGEQRRCISNGDDSFLSQYIKSLEIQTTLNDHQLYFKALEKQRKVKSLEIYQKYLNTNRKVEHEKNYKQYLSKISPRLQRRDVTPSEPATKDTPSAEVTTSTTKKHDQRANFLEPHKEKLPSTHITHQLPLEFMDCPIDYLIDLISRMLQSLITLNDKSVPSSISNPPSSTTTSNGSQSSNSLLTRYHSRTPPAISALTYLSRLTKFNNFNPAILLTTIYYIDLLSHQYQPFFTLNSWTVHRFLLVATMIAQKSLEDFFYTNDHYAKVGGVALGELNCLELDFLNRVDWRCVPGKQVLNKGTGMISTNIGQAKDVLNLYYCQLIDLMGKNNNIVGDGSLQQQQQPVYYIKEGSEGGGNRRRSRKEEEGSSPNSEDADDYMSGDEEVNDDEEEEEYDEDEEDEEEDKEGDEDEGDFYDDDSGDDERAEVVDADAGADADASNNYKLQPNPTQVYNANGFVMNGSSSPHLKRRYSGS